MLIRSPIWNAPVEARNIEALTDEIISLVAMTSATATAKSDSATLRSSSAQMTISPTIVNKNAALRI